MRFFEFVIYFLNWDACAKRSALLFLVIELYKQNGFLFLFEGESLEDQL